LDTTEPAAGSQVTATDADDESGAIESKMTTEADAPEKPLCSRDGTSEMPALTSQDAAGAERSSASARGPGREPRQGVSSHTWVTQRISELERERSSRWKRLFQLVGGGHHNDSAH
jgi:hypothetical protein